MAANSFHTRGAGPDDGLTSGAGEARRRRAGFVSRVLDLTDFRSRRNSLAVFVLFMVVSLAWPLNVSSQSGRRKDPNVKTSGNTTSGAKASGKSQIPASSTNTQQKPATPAAESDEIDPNDVIRVSSNLVPIPATVLDARGFAVTNLKVDDFELRIDGQPKPISELTRTETPVRMVMLFDNSGSLSAAREFEKRAAMHFFGSVMRPLDQAAIYSVSTDVILAQPLTSDVYLLEGTIESFGRPEGSTALFDAIAEGAAYLKPYQGRRVIVIVSDGKETTSRLDFETTLQRIISDDCQVYVVQTGLYENANVRDLVAERRMEEFSSQSGGAVYIPKSVADLETAFGQIAADLAQQYVLSYYPADDKRDGQYHAVSVRVVTRPSVRVRSRKVFVVRKQRGRR
ncbi:MAG: Ca-activated chloride channel [Blastocatellia bacterium]|nr:Ca-activated chloride channel [Blastocatellia bacterium]